MEVTGGTRQWADTACEVVYLGRDRRFLNNNQKRRKNEIIFNLNVGSVSRMFIYRLWGFLDIKPLNDIVLENFWDEKSDVDNMISGCYSTMQSGDFVYRLMVWGEVRSDNIVAGNNVNTNVDLSNIFEENLRANNSYTKWEKFYSVINSCNLIIKYAPQVAEKSLIIPRVP